MPINRLSTQPRPLPATVGHSEPATLNTPSTTVTGTTISAPESGFDGTSTNTSRPAPATTGGTGALAVRADVTKPGVQNKALKKKLMRAFRAGAKHFDRVGSSRRPDNAYPAILAGRREVWSTVADVLKSRPGRETPELKAALAELKDFSERWSMSRDEANMPRIWHGYSAERPGLIKLMQNTFVAAGMGEVPRG